MISAVGTGTIWVDLLPFSAYRLITTLQIFGSDVKILAGFTFASFKYFIPWLAHRLVTGFQIVFDFLVGDAFFTTAVFQKLMPVLADLLKTAFKIQGRHLVGNTLFALAIFHDTVANLASGLIARFCVLREDFKIAAVLAGSVLQDLLSFLACGLVAAFQVRRRELVIITIKTGAFDREVLPRMASALTAKSEITGIPRFVRVTIFAITFRGDDLLLLTNGFDTLLCITCYLSVDRAFLAAPVFGDSIIRRALWCATRSETEVDSCVRLANGAKPRVFYIQAVTTRFALRRIGLRRHLIGSAVCAGATW